MTQLVTPVATLPSHQRLALAAWLDAQQSPLTRSDYHAVLQRFCAELQRVGLDLGSNAGQVAVVAQVWAALGDVGAVTHNKRLSIASSFYRYAIQRQLLPPPNPIETVARRKIQRYARARALDLADVRGRLATIDRDSLAGQRDYVLLSVALTTGRRLRELAGLRGGDLEQRSDGRLRLTWTCTKGGDVLYDTLPAVLSALLRGYLQRVYDAGLGDLAPAAPVWVSVSNNNRGGPLSVSALADICQRWLGTSKVHQLRHTFAQQMEQRGAKVSEIQRRLGHRSAATTAIYLEALRSDENPYAEALVEGLGVG